MPNPQKSIAKQGKKVTGTTQFDGPKVSEMRVVSFAHDRLSSCCTSPSHSAYDQKLVEPEIRIWVEERFKHRPPEQDLIFGARQERRFLSSFIEKSMEVWLSISEANTAEAFFEEYCRVKKDMQVRSNRSMIKLVGIDGKER